MDRDDEEILGRNSIIEEDEPDTEEPEEEEEGDLL
jgi:hypothetical protein